MRTSKSNDPKCAVVQSATPATVPSPLSGERVRVRGGYCPTRSISSTASATSPAAPVAHCPDALPVPASLPRLCRAQTERPSVVSSKTCVFVCCATLDTHRVLHPSFVAPEIRVDPHPVQDCSALRHNRNRGNGRRHCVAVETCRRRSGGRGESPITSSRPKWIFSASHERVNWNSSETGLTQPERHFKRCRLLPPLTLALSPLRGEGIRSDRHGKYGIVMAVEALTPFVSYHYET